MNIGIPQALLYYYYYPLWQPFLEQLGAKTIVSKPTDQDIIHQGSRVSVPEICVPIKVFNGHVNELLNKGVDYIFAPRMVQVEKGLTFCPKFLGLPDMLDYTFPAHKNQMLAPQIKGTNEWSVSSQDLQKEPFFAAFDKSRLEAAWQIGVKAWNRFREICRRGYLIPEALDLYQKPDLPKVKNQQGEIKIGLIGYVYDIYDKLVGMEICQRLQEMGADLSTFEMLQDKDIDRQIDPMKKSLFWTFSNKVFGAGLHFYQQPEIDGIIHVTAFGCGPDSLSGKMMELDAEKYGKPFMTVRVDEHSGESHLQTRIEAFTDMLKRRKRLRLIELGVRS
ncbi:MAG: acyl-CoA dehydratase activase-related protein [Clostridiales bacterium]|jgi:predicted nucleotide-binding protein (sugar kinase/HSP70/actin superfamily)|nr:acyl-CoA dehydratase activase-related protein [Clostridiales bacterium]